MEFWGVEVKSGQTFDVSLGEGKVLHLSQACLGEMKKDTKDSVCLQIVFDGKKLVLGTLHSERLPQQLFDLVFDKDFQISHNWKNGSVFFYGYKAEQPSDDHDESEDFDSEDEEMELPVPAVNGKQEAKKEEKAAVVGGGKKEEKAAGKQKVKIVEPAKGESDDEDDSDDSDAMSEDSDDDEENDDSSDDEEDSEEEEETPKKEQSGKKRPNESASKTPVTGKKAKNTATPQKTEGKKGGAVHIATPHPSKQAVAKTPAGGSKSNQKSPASAADGAHSCKACNRNFKTEGALSSHNQAKHASK